MRPRSLTEHEIRAMRYMRHDKPWMTHREIGKCFGVSRDTVGYYLRMMPPYEESHVIENVPSGINKIVDINTMRKAA